MLFVLFFLSLLLNLKCETIIRCFICVFFLIFERTLPVFYDWLHDLINWLSRLFDLGGSVGSSTKNPSEVAINGTKFGNYGGLGTENKPESALVTSQPPANALREEEEKYTSDADFQPKKVRFVIAFWRIAVDAMQSDWTCKSPEWVCLSFIWITDCLLNIYIILIRIEYGHYDWSNVNETLLIRCFIDVL